MHIYVAGKLDDVDAVRSVQQKLHDATHVIIQNWTSNKDGLSSTLAERDAVRRKCADDNIKGVKSVDLVFILFTDPKYEYRETCCELGAACVLGKKVVAVCPHYKALPPNCAFVDEPEYAKNYFFQATGVQRCATIEEGLALVDAYASKPRLSKFDQVVAAMKCNPSQQFVYGDMAPFLPGGFAQFQAAVAAASSTLPTHDESIET